MLCHYIDNPSEAPKRLSYSMNTLHFTLYCYDPDKKDRKKRL